MGSRETYYKAVVIEELSDDNSDEESDFGEMPALIESEEEVLDEEVVGVQSERPLAQEAPKYANDSSDGMPDLVEGDDDPPDLIEVSTNSSDSDQSEFDIDTLRGTGGLKKGFAGPSRTESRLNARRQKKAAQKSKGPPGQDRAAPSAQPHAGKDLATLALYNDGRPAPGVTTSKPETARGSTFVALKTEGKAKQEQRQDPAERAKKKAERLLRQRAKPQTEEHEWEGVDLAQQFKEEQQKLRQEKGLVQEEVEVARCALRPGTLSQEACLQSGTITGQERYIKVVCSEGCEAYYHHPGCWKKCENELKASRGFSWKSKEPLQCVTDACPGTLVHAGLYEGNDPSCYLFRKIIYEREPEKGPAAGQRNHGRGGGGGEAKQENGDKRGKDRKGKKDDADAKAAVQEARKRVKEAQPGPAAVQNAAADNNKTAAQTEDTAENGNGEAAAEAWPVLPKSENLRLYKKEDVEDIMQAAAPKEKAKHEKRQKPKFKKLQIDIAFRDSPAPAAAPPADAYKAFEDNFGGVMPPSHAAPSATPPPPPPPAVPAPQAWAAPGRASSGSPAVPARVSSAGGEFPSLDDAAAMPGTPSAERPPPRRQNSELEGAVDIAGVREALDSLQISVDEGVHSCHLLVEELDVEQLDRQHRAGRGASLENTLITLFSQHGMVDDYTVFRPLGAAAVSMTTLLAAIHCKALLHGHLLQRFPIRVTHLAEFPSRDFIDGFLARRMAQRTSGAVDIPARSKQGWGRPAEVPKAAQLEPSSSLTKLSIAAREFVPTGTSPAGQAGVPPKMTPAAPEFRPTPPQAPPRQPPSQPAPAAAPPPAPQDPLLTRFVGAQLVGSNAELIAQYRQLGSFWLDAAYVTHLHLIKPGRPVALLLYLIDKRQLEGLWVAVPPASPQAAGVTFNVVRFFQPLPLSGCRHLLPLDGVKEPKYPAYLEADAVQAIIHMFLELEQGTAGTPAPVSAPTIPAPAPPAQPDTVEQAQQQQPAERAAAPPPSTSVGAAPAADTAPATAAPGAAEPEEPERSAAEWLSAFSQLDQDEELARQLQEEEDREYAERQQALLAAYSQPAPAWPNAPQPMPQQQPAAQRSHPVPPRSLLPQNRPPAAVASDAGRPPVKAPTAVPPRPPPHTPPPLTFSPAPEQQAPASTAMASAQQPQLLSAASQLAPAQLSGFPGDGARGGTAAAGAAAVEQDAMSMFPFLFPSAPGAQPAPPPGQSVPFAQTGFSLQLPPNPAPRVPMRPAGRGAYRPPGLGIATGNPSPLHAAFFPGPA